MNLIILFSLYHFDLKRIKHSHINSDDNNTSFYINFLMQIKTTTSFMERKITDLTIDMKNVKLVIKL